ncbi:MAG: hypothetical protein ACKN89_13585 [Cyanobium sp.]
MAGPLPIAQQIARLHWRIQPTAGSLGGAFQAPMGGDHHWSVMLSSSRLGRPRWLSDSGRLTSDPRRALRLLSAELAAQRLQLFSRLRGWELSRLERFQLVPAPARRQQQKSPRRSGGLDQG